MVGHPHDKVEWEVPSQEGSGLSDRFRYIPDRMGCNLSEPKDLLGATLAVKTFLKQIQDVSASQIGQYHSSAIHKQSGRDSLQGIGRLSKKSAGMWCLERNIHITAQHLPGCSEHNSFNAESRTMTRLVRLAIEPSPVQQDCFIIRSNRSGLVHHSTDHSVPSLFQLAARSLCSSNRWFSAGLVTNTGVCQPTMEYSTSQKNVPIIVQCNIVWFR